MNRTISESELPLYAAHALRFLAIDAVEAAKNGHPGMPMGMADIATVLWTRFLRANPANPRWINRDRFVLSNGHGSMLLYGLLHLSGYGLPMEELRNFRKLHSKTPGHPEYGETPGVEVTTGPLGQGISNAVGMALGERHLAERFNRPGHAPIDHVTYVLTGDGCLQEGVSHEACSLAGHLGLGKLIVLYDDNQITIDGATSLSSSEDVAARFDAYQWHTQKVDGHDHGAVAGALQAALANGAQPSIILCRTTIGYGAPNKGGTAGTHGSPLGAEEIAATRENLSWPWPPFEIPAPVTEFWAQNQPRGAAAEQQWQGAMEAYRAAYPNEAKDLERIGLGQPDEGWRAPLEALKAAWRDAPPKLNASRAYSGMVLDQITPANPEMVGGSADLTGSNNTLAKGQADIAPGAFGGHYIRYGIREHGMAAIMNGLALHGGVVPYSGTFLCFSDYMRPSLRLAALMRIQVIHVFTHDSIGLGMDGPTHQPVEHYAALRAIPHLYFFRPADARETLEAWECALNYRQGPSALSLSRQPIPHLEGSGNNQVARGGYVLQDAPQGLELHAVLLATGSEVQLAVTARAALAAEGVGARVVSLPCWELFTQQPESYQREVLRPEIGIRVAVEAGIAQGWERFTGNEGAIICMTGFGASAPDGDLYREFGITADAVTAAAKKQL